MFCNAWVRAVHAEATLLSLIVCVHTHNEGYELTTKDILKND